MNVSIAALRRVPRLDPLRAVERELVLLGLALGGDRLEDSASWSPPRIRSQDPRGEPVRQVVEDRQARGPLVPGAAGELVDLVAGLAAEELGEVLAVLGHEVDREVLGPLGDAVRAVLVREPDEEARRVDADLRREADQAARALAVRRRPS